MKKQDDMTLLEFESAMKALNFRRCIDGIEDIATGKWASRNGRQSLSKTLEILKKKRERWTRDDAMIPGRAERNAHLLFQALHRQGK